MYYRALKLIRQYHRLSQVELAEALGLSKSFISELEKKDGKKPSIDVLERYAAYFKVPLSSLLLFAEGSDSKKANEKARAYATDKVLKMLEWIEETSRVDKSSAR